VTEAFPRENRRAAWIIFLTSFLAYAYFFQGIGWNQFAHFSTMRALAEHGNADITDFTWLTQDITVNANGTFSNKPPGIALLGTPFYFVLMRIERMLGIDCGGYLVMLKNLHALTILLSALPGAILNVQLFYAFRRERLSVRTAMLMSGAFAFGSLSWPYSGLLMSHLAVAALTFGAWYLLTHAELTMRRAVAAGMLIALAILCDLLTVPVAALLGLYLILRRAPARLWLTFSACSTLGILAILLYNRIAHGGAAQSGNFHPTTTFSNPDLLFGQFSWPQWRRLYWITYQPMRGLFTTCPMFIVCLIALLLIRRPFRMRLDRVAILLILAVYLLFYLTFIGWSGGWGVGLRYAIPALPLLWMFAIEPFKRFPRLCAIIIVLSILQMLAVTSVCVLMPSPKTDQPNGSDPVRADLIVFLQGRTNWTGDGYNLGELIGLWERLHLLPIYALLTIFYTCAFTRPNRQSADEALSSRGFQLEKQ
jgi:hypothetical protein